MLLLMPLVGAISIGYSPVLQHPAQNPLLLVMASEVHTPVQALGP